MVRLRGASGTMGVKGSFWADASTFELVRLTSEGEDLPAWFPDKSLSGEVAYGRVRFGASVILLPVSSDMHAESFTGARRWNHSTFAGCRQYSSESVISYAETGREGSTESKVNEVVSLKLRPGIELELRLDNMLDSASALVGDSVRARLARAVHLAGGETLPRGAVATGVIRNLEKENAGDPWYTVGLEFNGLEYPGHRAIFSGVLVEVSGFPGLQRNLLAFLSGDPAGPANQPDVGYFYVTGDPIRVPAGTRLTWRTR
jgi:hypothetical protein